MVSETLNGWAFFEVASFEDLQDSVASVPAMAYVRELDDYFLLHDATYLGDPSGENVWSRHSDVGSGIGIFQLNVTSTYREVSTWIFFLLAVGANRQDPNTYTEGFEDLVSLDYNAKLRYLVTYLQDETFRPLTTPKVSRFLTRKPLDGDIFISNGEIRCNTENLGIKGLKQGEPGIVIRNGKPLTLDSTYGCHNKRLGVIVLAKDAKKGDSSLTCSVLPASLPHTTNNASAKYWVTNYAVTKPIPTIYPPSSPVNPGETRPNFWGPPQTCLVDPRTLEDPAARQEDLPYALEHACWCAAPWEVVNIPVSGISYVAGGSWPDGLTANVSFGEPIPQPIVSTIWLRHSVPSPYRYMPPPDRSAMGHNAGNIGGYLGAQSVPVRMTTGRFGVTNGTEFGLYIKAGSKKLKLIRSSTYLGGVSDYGEGYTGFKGAMANDMAVFENHDTIYRIAEVTIGKDYTPSTFTLASGVGYDMHEVTQIGEGVHLFIGPKVYWLPTGANTGEYSVPFAAWTLPDGDLGPMFNSRGFPVFLKSVRGKVVTLTTPLSADIPAGTRMPIYSFEDNDCTTLAYKDTEGFILDVELYNLIRDNYGFDNLQALLDILSQDYQNLMNDLQVARLKTAYNWFMPPDYGAYDPYLLHTKHGGTFQEAISNCNSRIASVQQLRRIPAPDLEKIEYLSLLNYDRGVHIEIIP